ncbi:PTS transporter subunit EIIC [Vibrio nomapromontoriensis]|uniref:PTS transporter subunit EIIC n=1 Tax=Vibrio nomapromontoriensis TaxID=2910246 RepID=UPI003D151902
MKQILSGILNQLQRIGASLMLPIAVLPVAALLLRFGSPDLLDLPFVKASGGAIFGGLPMLFAVGIAVGLAKDHNGTAGVAGVIAHLIILEGAKTITPDLKMGVLSGIIAGLMAGYLYNNFKDTKLPDWLGFFGGKRFVPIVTALCSIVMAFIVGHGFPAIGAMINNFGMWMIESGEPGLFVYGAMNRLLIPFGLHHILNSIVRFMFGSYTDPSGTEIIGDQLRFFAGDPEAGAFMTGCYVVMMFGLPAVCLAFYTTAKKERRKALVGMLVSISLTSFLTGITEPIEFLFMFTAPILFALHAILMGMSYVISDLLNIKHGFGFSGGFIDYVLNWNLSTNPIRIIPLGLAYFAIYFVTFTAAIKYFNLKTPGREDDEEAVESVKTTTNNDELAGAYYAAAGGYTNIQNINCCMTRLRLTLESSDLVDDAACKRLGAAGVIRPTPTTVQIIVGTSAEMIAEDMRAKHLQEAEKEADSLKKAAT